LKAAQAQLLQSVLEQTDELRRLLESGDWDRLAEVAAQRQQQLEALFANAIDSSEAPLIAESIRAILHADGETAEMIRHSRTSLEQAMGELGINRRATRAYLNNL
jgi:membrane-associated HD superfamily phosphohydrolase